MGHGNTLYVLVVLISCQQEIVYIYWQTLFFLFFALIHLLNMFQLEGNQCIYFVINLSDKCCFLKAVYSVLPVVVGTTVPEFSAPYGPKCV